MDGLKPCPFCGFEAEYWGEENMVWCRCSSCEAQRIFKFDEPEEAAKDWNERIPDINIPSDRLQEICEAEQEGRIVILPCKVGDTVYVIGGHIVPAEVEWFSLEKEFTICTSFECDDSCEGCPFKHYTQSHEGEWDCESAYGYAPIKCSDFGKTVFLTMEDAEAALKAGEEKC